MHTCLNLLYLSHLSFSTHHSLFCSYGDRVEHFRVLEGCGQYCIWDETFCSLNLLVDFYRTHSIAVDKVIRLRDPPSSPHLVSHPAFNPYPNPYKSSSQESLLAACLYSQPPHPERGSSPHLLEPVLRVWWLARCYYSPQTACTTIKYTSVCLLSWLCSVFCAETPPGSCPV